MVVVLLTGSVVPDHSTKRGLLHGCRSKAVEMGSKLGKHVESLQKWQIRVVCLPVQYSVWDLQKLLSGFNVGFWLSPGL